ncbi:histone-like protein 18C [Drosophila obscura]|uniref:histone-like protein 18C n=1 Tax=Drosophila obscura TaxID=7282 RepID=UPI001BB2AB95|nr:histone-like protein 18C [Drosophila obscura]
MSLSSVNESDESLNEVLSILSAEQINDNNPRSSSESAFESSDADGALTDSIRGRSTIAFLNYMRECKRRFGQKAVNVAAQRWRTMSPEQRSRYRRAGTEENDIASSTDASDSSLDEGDCGFWNKRKRSCKSKRKKSSCGKRRRKKSACQKKKRKKSCSKPKKSCGKSRRKSRRAKKCNKSEAH